MSKIEWTDQTWNPIVGCTKVSSECLNCYAEREARRFAFNPKTPQYAKVIRNGYWNGKTAFVESALEKPLHWRKPRMIFVCSMSDLFHETVPFEWIDRVFAAMALCPQHTFQVLTKRPKRMREYLSSEDTQERINECMTVHPLDIITSKVFDIPMIPYNEIVGVDATQASPEPVLDEAPEFPWPLPNVWLGVTAGTQQAADERVPVLLDTPATVRFVSVEPMLEEVDLSDFEYPYDRNAPGLALGHDWLTGEEWSYSSIFGGGPSWIEGDDYGEKRLHWVICGGESGTCARPMHPDWARSLRDQCKKAVVPFLFKQWGEWVQSKPDERDTPHQGWWHPDYPAGQLPGPGDERGCWGDEKLAEAGCIHVSRVGKNAAGRALDGVVHDEYPEVTK